MVMDINDFYEMKDKEECGEPVYLERFPYSHEENEIVVITDAGFNDESGVACLAVVLPLASLDYIFGKSIKQTRSDTDRPFKNSNIIAEADGTSFGLRTILDFVRKNKGKYQKVKVYNDCDVVVIAYNTGRTIFPEDNATISMLKVNEMRSEAGEPHLAREQISVQIRGGTTACACLGPGTGLTEIGSGTGNEGIGIWAPASPSPRRTIGKFFRFAS